MSWAEAVALSEERNLLAKQLYLVLTNPVHGPEPVQKALSEHLAYQSKLEQEGVMFAAGPLSDDAGQEWLGNGMFVYRAASLEEATKLAAADPMHRSGARSFTVRAWLMNEGTLSVRLNYSAGKTEII